VADKYLSTKTRSTALYICEYIFIKELKMKQLIAIILATFALATFAAEPATAPASAPKQEMKLAKKKADKEAEKKDATKSPSKPSK
jgi:ribosomal protein L12E/L44/L45/RPP1/RPP2